MLSENYRSHQHVIDAAEHIVRAAPAIAGKKAKASGEATELWPVQVLDRDDQGLAQRLAGHYEQGDSILMLFRKSSDKLLIENVISQIVNVDSSLPPGSRRLKQLTYHSAKGLQADAVFLLGDCQHLSSSPYKNQVYRMAGLGKDGDAEPYDSAQKDEILRLAYVGITRAAKHCYWYVDRQEGPRAMRPRLRTGYRGTSRTSRTCARRHEKSPLARRASGEAAGLQALSARDGEKASSSSSTASIIRSTSAALITVAQGMPAMAIMVSPLARSKSRAIMLPGASMLASKPMG
ncbi:hypothetical protein PBOI14_41410 [Pseudomonas sp. Boi14]|nr:hypothetical protein PBOI14_41410 [Pseudomonas sp. Boi14]